MIRSALCTLFCLVIFWAAGANAKSISEKQKRALNILHGEISDCAMYFNISSQGVTRIGSAKANTISQRSIKWRNHLISMATEIGKRIGLSKKAINARFKLSFESQMDEIDNDFGNYSILLKKHLKPCATLIKELNERIDRAMEP